MIIILRNLANPVQLHEYENRCFVISIFHRWSITYIESDIKFEPFLVHSRHFITIEFYGYNINEEYLYALVTGSLNTVTKASNVLWKDYACVLSISLNGHGEWNGLFRTYRSRECQGRLSEFLRHNLSKRIRLFNCTYLICQSLLRLN